LVVFSLLATVGFLFSAVVLLCIGRLFRRRLTFSRAKNLVGYSQAPRFVVSMIATAWLIVLPARALESTMGVVIAIALLALAYTVVLLIWGIAAAPRIGEESGDNPYEDTLYAKVSDLGTSGNPYA